MRRLGLNVALAYPGTLGPKTPSPPSGYVFLVQYKELTEPPPAPNNDGYGYDEFVYLTDDEGNFLLVESE